MDNIEIYFYLITTIVYIFMIMSIVGIIWGFLLSINKTRAIIIQSMRTRKKGWFWFLNVTFWTVPFSLVAGFYFFSIWYVMNPQAKIYWFPHP
ncbi:unknown similar to AMEV171 [Adoxophyes honmai entomopoxvirus 'L']|uniref:Uncharacterized protein n=1 Tax=Adoxophyes honmai entomopoxvirus 'L' TaxID=1293540 RepID=A0A916NX03_9POXV|nr:unknown similar to AMEV171 [Adoxophyes honmai entomopoxvirus 'L']CCU55483.1 unknown similar to AMEV171 [Adoxophyes honmai entomopoxvirus 'L']